MNRNGAGDGTTPLRGVDPAHDPPDEHRPPQVGLTVRIRRHRLRGGWTALISSGLAAAGGVLLVVMVPVGLATGGLSIGRPEGVSIALFAVWMVLFGGTGIALRRE
jgi:hypothetical protein